jgi:hypothetical protein
VVTGKSHLSTSRVAMHSLVATDQLDLLGTMDIWKRVAATCFVMCGSSNMTMSSGGRTWHAAPESGDVASVRACVLRRPCLRPRDESRTADEKNIKMLGPTPRNARFRCVSPLNSKVDVRRLNIVGEKQTAREQFEAAPLPAIQARSPFSPIAVQAS